MVKYYFLVIICILSIIGYGSALDQNEQVEANKILTAIGESGSDPCTIFSCDVSKTNIQIIDLHNLGSYADFSSVDFAVFTQLIQLNLGSSSIFGTSKILNQISSLTHLVKFVQTNLVESVDVNLSSLVNLQMDNFQGIFYAKWVNPNLQTLSIGNTVDFSLSGSFQLNRELYSLQLPVPSDGLPDLDRIFPSLTTLNLLMKDITYPDGSVIPSSYLGSFKFNSLISLTFTFESNTTSNNPSLSKLIYLPDFSGLTNLEVFTINGDIFILNQTKGIDLSNAPYGRLYVTIQRTKKLLGSCYDCIRLPENTEIEINYANVTIDNLNLSNCSFIKLSVIDTVQNVTFRGFNFDRLTQIDIASSNFYGPLVDEICKIPYSMVSIKSNFFSKPPSCYVCTDDLLTRSKILPNKFTNFDSTTPATCPGFSAPIQNLYTVLTEGDSIVISGKDLGFVVQVPNDVTYSYESINYRIRIITPAYSGGDGTTKQSITITFPIVNQSLVINYQYAAPQIFGYFYFVGQQILYLIGTGFDYNDSQNNKITLNTTNQELTATAYPNPSRLHLLNLDTSTSTPYIAENQYFSIKVETGSQVSATTSLLLTSPILYISDQPIPLKTTGSTFDLNGSFLSSDASKAKVIVGKVVCQVTQLSSSSLTFVYPATELNEIGDVTLYLMIDGKAMTGKATIIQGYLDTFYNTQDSSSSSSLGSSGSSGSSSKSNSNDSSSGDDNVNSSTKLNFNLLSFISLIIISYLII